MNLANGMFAQALRMALVAVAGVALIAGCSRDDDLDSVDEDVAVEEPPVLRFFFGKLEAIDNWGRQLCDAFKSDFGDSA